MAMSKQAFMRRSKVLHTNQLKEFFSTSSDLTYLLLVELTRRLQEEFNVNVFRPQ